LKALLPLSGKRLPAPLARSLRRLAIMGQFANDLG
jgi:hypothetical protein